MEMVDFINRVFEVTGLGDYTFLAIGELTVEPARFAQHLDDIDLD